MKGIGVFIGAGVAILGCSVFLLGCTTVWTADTVRSCSSLQSGDLVRLTDSDNGVHSGVFCEMTKMEFLAYVEHAKQMALKAPEHTVYPLPGERITFTTVLEPYHEWNGVLMGFCSEYLWVRLKGDTEISHFYISGVTRLSRWDGQTILRDKLRAMIADNQLPMMSLVSIRTGDDTLQIALNDITHLEVIERASVRKANETSGL